MASEPKIKNEDENAIQQTPLPVFKKSHYNISAKTQNGFRLFNTRTGSVVDFDVQDPQFSEFNRIWVTQNFSLQEHEWLPALYAQGFLVPLTENGNEEIKDYQKKFNLRINSSNSMDIIVMPTEDCNFRCSYCYENFKKGEMNVEVQDALKCYLAKIIPSINHLSITWFGGEPFLADNVIKNISLFAIEKARNTGTVYHASVTTNGYLLTLELFEKALNEWMVKSFQVTVDGIMDFHDSRRKLIDGSGTFHHIMKNITEISKIDSHKNFEFIIRMNIDKNNLNNVYDFMRFIKSIINNDKRFTFFARPIWGNNTYEKLTKRDELSLTSLIGNLCKELNLNWYDRDVFLDPRKGMCYAAKPNSLVIGSDGMIYKCTANFDLPENHIGFLDKSGSLNLDSEKIRLWTRSRVNIYSQCQNCNLLPLCNGATCPKEEIEKQFYLKGSNKPYLCSQYKKILKKVIKDSSF